MEEYLKKIEELMAKIASFLNKLPEGRCSRDANELLDLTYQLNTLVHLVIHYYGEEADVTSRVLTRKEILAALNKICKLKEKFDG